MKIGIISESDQMSNLIDDTAIVVFSLHLNALMKTILLTQIFAVCEYGNYLITFGR